MTTIFINSNIDYADIVPAPIDGDSLDLRDDGYLTIQQTTAVIDDIFINYTSRTVEVLNTSITEPVFLRLGFDAGSIVNVPGGNLVTTGGYIQVGIGDGTPSQSFALPTDAGGLFYEDLCFVKVDGVSWYQNDGFTDLYADERGQSFFHDTALNTITCGDGVNGKIWPVGAIITIPNIQIQTNGVRLNSGGVIRLSATSISGGLDMTSGGRHVFDGVGIYNSQRVIDASDFQDNRYIDFVLTGDASNNTQMTLRKGTHGRILFASNSTATASAIIDGSSNYTVDELFAIFTAPRGSSEPRIRLNLNGSTINKLYSLVGGLDACFRYSNGIGGTIGEFLWSMNSKRSQSPLRYIIIYQGTNDNCAINSFTRIGSEPFQNITRPFDLVTGTNISVKGFDTPLDFSCSRLFEWDQPVTGVLSDMTINGSITDTVERDFNIDAQLGSKIRNIKIIDDVDTGNRASLFMEWDNVTMVGNLPSIGTFTRSITTRSTNDRTQGHIGLQPFYNPAVFGSVLLAGDPNSYKFTLERFHLADTVTKIQVETRGLGGITGITSLQINGSNVGNFDIEYDMKLRGSPYSGVFQSLTLGNLQSSFAALPAHTPDYDIFIKYNVQKNSGDIVTTYINDIFIGCDFDPTFEWVDIENAVNITLPNLVEPSKVLVRNSTKDTELSIGFSGGAGFQVELTPGNDFDVGDTIEVFVTAQNGTTVWEKERVALTIGSEDITIPLTQTILEPFSAANGFVDGSTLTNYSFDGVNVQIDVNDPDGFDKKRNLVSWYYYAITTDLGIRMFFDELDLIDTSNGRLNNGVLADNISNRQLYYTDSDFRLFKADGSDWILFPSTGGYGIHVNTETLPPNLNNDPRFDTIDLLRKYHDNRSRFYGIDGITEVAQGDAYFMVVLDDDNMTELKRISFLDPLDQPANINEATRYIKV